MLQSLIKTVLLAIVGIVFLLLAFTIVFLYMNIEDCRLQEQIRIIEQADHRIQTNRFGFQIICSENSDLLPGRQL